MTELLNVEHVQKVYHSRGNQTPVTALKDVNFIVENGEFVAIMGESGSGKSTLLNLLATLDQPTAGKITLQQHDLTQIKEANAAAFRREHLGFVFQEFNLLDTFSVKDNILLPLVLSRSLTKSTQTELTKIATQLGLETLLEHYPYELSGGQKQRVAIARAIITHPELVLADEPTGALDSRHAEQTLSLFEQLNAAGQTLIMVTHSALAASHAQRVLFIKDGQVFHQLYRGSTTQSDFFETISSTLTALLTKKVN